MNKENALKAIEEFFLRERAKVRITSKVSRSNEEASLGKALRLTGTLNKEILSRSQVSSPPVELIMRSCKD
jgi:hypothetical protein